MVQQKAERSQGGAHAQAALQILQDARGLQVLCVQEQRPVCIKHITSEKISTWPGTNPLCARICPDHHAN